MRTRNQRSIYSPWRLSALVSAACGVGLIGAAGCGGGGGSNPPTISNNVIVTRPSPMTYVGGTANISVQVTDPSGINASTVKVDVTDPTGTSLIGGPQTMSPAANPANTYTYQVTLPNNLSGSSSKVYTVSVTAANNNGTALIAPVVVGAITVPNPPAPPPGPS